MKLGCHVANNGTKMLVGSIEEAISYDANCFMVYLGAPQNTFRKPLSQMNAQEMAIIAKQNNIALEDVIVHAPYIVNLGQTDVEKHRFAVEFLSQEVRGVEQIGAKYLVLHPGAHVGNGVDTAITQIINGINKIINLTPSCSTVICLETMAGKGTEVGRLFEEIKMIIDGVKDKSRIGVCLDTCHIHDAGYDIVNNYDEVLEEFDRIIGYNFLHVIHLNDSKNSCGAHKDRHENVGLGNVGFLTLLKVVNDARFENIPKILETPYVQIPGTKDSLPPYLHEIKMIKNGSFNDKLIEDVLKK